MNLVHSYCDVIRLLKDPSIGELRAVRGHCPHFYKLFNCEHWDVFSETVSQHVEKTIFSTLFALPAVLALGLVVFMYSII